MECPKCQKWLGSIHWRKSQWHQKKAKTPIRHLFNCCRDCGNVMANLHAQTEEVREAAQFLCQMIDLLKADSGKLQSKFKQVFEGMTYYSAETRKTLSHSGCLYYLSQPHDPGNSLYTSFNFSCQFNQHREQQGLVVLATVMQLSEAVLGAYCLG